MLQKFTIGKVGTLGLLKDVEASMTPLEGWTDARNVRFLLEKTKKSWGTSTYDAATTVPPYWMFYAKPALQKFFVYAGLAKLYAFDETGVEANITRVAGDYTGSAGDVWLGNIFNGYLILTNGIDLPQSWVPDVSTPALAVKLANWDDNHRAKVIRPFLNFLVALDITKSGTRFPFLIKWSHSSATGLPSSWDETDASVDAGEKDLGETSDILIDCLPLGFTNIIYKEFSTWGMRFTGGTHKFAFQPIFRDSGILAPNCFAQLGNKHFVVTKEDIIVHDGVRFDSVAEKKIRREFFDNLDPGAATGSFVLKLETDDEIWVFGPTLGSTVIERALVWNWKFNTWTIQDVSSLTGGVVAAASTSRVGQSWDAESTLTWGAGFSGADVGDLLTLEPNHGHANDDIVEVGAGTGFTLPVGLAASTTYHIINYSSDTCQLSLSSGGAAVVITADGDGVIALLGTLEKDLVWDDPSLLTNEEKIFFSAAGASKIYRLDRTLLQDSGVSYRSYIERTGIAVASKAPITGAPIINKDIVKKLLAVWPQINAAAGTEIDIYVAGIMELSDTYVWQGPYTFTVGTTVKIDAPVTGRFLGVRFEETNNVDWSLQGYTLELSTQGQL